MAPHQSSKVVKTKFEDLPQELITDILAHLATKEVLRARSISRHFRNILHNWDNEKAIALTITRRSHTRIREFIDSTLLFPTSRPFHLAFATFLVHRGIHQNHPDRFVDITAFVHLWLHVHHGPVSPDLGPEEKSFRTSGLSVSLIIFAMAIIDVWSLQHHPEFPTNQPKAVQSRAAFVDDALRRSSQSRVISRIYGWDGSHLGKVWDELTAPVPPFLESAQAARSSVQGGDRHVRGSNSSVAREAEEFWNVSNATIHPIDPCQTTPTPDPNYRIEPFRSLTKLRSPQYLQEQRKHPEGLCSSEWLEQTFGLPPLPTVSFAYYCKHEWSYRIIEMTIGELDPLVKAAVLEDISIF
ncbi:hypothetical protein LTR86_009094 [Recurvomyces mirabilis]|nr:hypothetical protein LTR86_009094 [Recurvomyces mirabilis]